MTDEKPLVSIGMPVYNGAKYLHQALDSLLAQDYENFELIISDNASTDGTQEICLEYAARDKRIQYHRNEKNKGPSWNFKRVLELASGDYFMWAAHDDTRIRDAIQAMVSHCVINPDSVFVGSGYDTVNYLTGDIKHNRVPSINVQNSCFENCCLLIQQPTPSLIYGLFKTEVLRKTRFLTIDFFDFGDVYLLYEIALMGRMHIISDVLYFAGVVAKIRIPKSFALFKLPGFRFGYFKYYGLTLFLLLHSKPFSWQEKIHLIQLLNQQVASLIIHHERAVVGKRKVSMLKSTVHCVNRVLGYIQRFSTI